MTATTPYPEFRDVAEALTKMGLLRDGEQFAIENLSGGVSCDVYRVDLERGPICVKRALPKLRVAADWYAPAARAETEEAWFRLAASVDAKSVPAILGQDRERHMFAMEFFPPDKYPVWKANLAAGNVDADFAAQVGSAIARIHAATAGRADIAAQFDQGAQFHALRIEPYLLFTAERHADVGPRIRALAQSVATAHIALMHGDVSPKNILCGPGGPIFLDAETACYGDPAFDLAFCLNHLLLKCVWHREYANAYLDSFVALKSAYLAGVAWEKPAAIDKRAAALLSAFLLARIDGKSPVEYLNAERDKNFVRDTAKRFLALDLTLDELLAAWRAALSP
ncbi:MAG TPA: aminoglycoside phosphotransferase family protein [Rhizomicrobium sp.]|nr:aminoglycoside phosphotransferase family protein [Rhizomicrobium sp.]